MVAFDQYQGPGFLDDGGIELRNSQGKKIVPILRVRQEFNVNNVVCARGQFPLTEAYAITVHKAQGQTLNTAVLESPLENLRLG
jgi:ATP-dependent exoDNAse (exonuclease V) alpha subunit